MSPPISSTLAPAMVPFRAVWCALRRLIIAGFCAAVAVAMAAPGAVRRSFDLPVDAADRSLKRFSEQSGLEVFYPSSETRGLRTRPVRGEMTAREALEAMLAGTGLMVVQDEQTGAFSVRKKDPNG